MPDSLSDVILSPDEIGRKNPLVINGDPSLRSG